MILFIDLTKQVDALQDEQFKEEELPRPAFTFLFTNEMQFLRIHQIQVWFSVEDLKRDTIGYTKNYQENLLSLIPDKFIKRVKRYQNRAGLKKKKK